jgi:FkbM family methyltransferase
MTAAPRLTIGLPVYNGERYLAGAIDALLGQSYKDFELIISDNASTDGTKEICQRYARQDARVRYIRQPRNIGLAPNHNVLVGQARGELFKWAANDDLYARELIERCVDALDEHPDVVLAHCWTALIDDSGTMTGASVYPLSTSSPRAPERFRSLLFDRGGDDCYGVIRTEVLRRTAMHESHHHAERNVITELALYGRFYQIPDWLYFRRDHPEQAERSCPTVRSRCANMDPRRADRLRHPLVRLYGEYVWAYVSAIWRAPLSAGDKRQCYQYLAQWFASRARLRRLSAAAPSSTPAMRREFHVRFCEGGGMRFPSATRLAALIVHLDLRIGFLAMKLALRDLYASALKCLPLAILVPFRDRCMWSRANSLPRRLLLPMMKALRYRHIDNTVDNFPIPDNPGVLLKNAPSLIVRNIFWLGQNGYESGETAIWCAYCKKASGILELGANIGLYTILGAIAAPSVSYRAVEPHPRAADILRANLALNNIPHVEVIEAAAVADAGKATMDLDIPAGDLDAIPSGGSIHGRRQGLRLRSRVTVRVKDVRELVSDVSLIKMDIEGAEAELLLALDDYIAEFRPTFFTEVLPDNTKLHEVIRDLRAKHGYRVLAISCTGLRRLELTESPLAHTLSEYGARDIILSPGTEIDSDAT